MRKVIVSMNVTLDGYMAGSDQGLEWHFKYWTDEMAEESAMQLSQADTILLGRKTYQAMAGYWPVKIVSPDFSRSDIVFAEMMNRYLKIVFSTTLLQVSWNNTLIFRKDIEKKMALLKKEKGKNIIVYGSGSVVGSLMNSGLIDEYQVWVHPVVLGDGRPFVIKKTMLRVFDEKRFASGVVLLFCTAAVSKN